MNIKKIVNEEDYKTALDKIGKLMEASTCSMDKEEIERLAKMLEEYVDKNNLLEIPPDGEEVFEYPWEQTLKTFN